MEESTEPCFRVSVKLGRFFSDERALCYLSVQSGRRVRWLRRRLRRLFGLPRRVALTCRGHLLPPDEPLALLRPDDPVEVIPSTAEWEWTHKKSSASNEETTVPEYEETCRKRRKIDISEHIKDQGEHPLVKSSTREPGNNAPLKSYEDTTVPEYEQNCQKREKIDISEYTKDQGEHPLNKSSPKDPGNNAPLNVDNVNDKSTEKEVSDEELPEDGQLEQVKAQALAMLARFEATTAPSLGRTRRRRRRRPRATAHAQKTEALEAPVSETISSSALELECRISRCSSPPTSSVAQNSEVAPRAPRLVRSLSDEPPLEPPTLSV